MTPDVVRRIHEENAVKFAGTTEFEGKVNEFIVPSQATPDGLRVSVYTPSSCSATSSIVVFFHGGGLVLGSRAGYDTMCKMISRDSSCIILSAEYRLGPEHRLPAPVDDAQCVMRWTLVNKTLIGGSNSSRIGVAGDSGGGQLAASVAHDVQGIDFQILIYPMCDMRCLEASYKEFATAPGLNQAVIDWFFSLSLKNNEQREDPKVSPMLRPSFRHLPPALFVLSELDPLRDSGYAYRDKLDSADVATECVLVQGAPHAFFNLPGHFKELCAQAYTPVIKFIKIFNLL
ncbi:carboxylic ester hydrolase LipN-like [Gigantopelta aegis]|uniref:carboxylic ester hydrolase LipN-like n=1 Tax=Gigantopelta aegis TaxID=1735272 RepID=UPI001B88A530|nr:carboxylic ester hydrolase LipN-like [Gigantopelta aegis]